MPLSGIAVDEKVFEKGRCLVGKLRSRNQIDERTQAFPEVGLLTPSAYKKMHPCRDSKMGRPLRERIPGTHGLVTPPKA